MIHLAFKLTSLAIVAISFVGWLHHAKGDGLAPASGSGSSGKPISGAVALIHALPIIYILMH